MHKAAQKWGKMDIGKIGTTNYLEERYLTKNTEKNMSENQFLETVSKKKSENTVDYEEQLLQNIAPNAPEEVKTAWKEAAKEVGVNGMGMKKNGMLSHISQMLVQQVINAYNGNPNPQDVMGDSVESAWRAAKKALYDLENPLAPINQRKLEVQEQIKKEKEFYKAFITKLEQFL